MGKNKKTTLVIGDDQWLLVEGIAGLLETEGFVIIGKALTPEDVIEQYKEKRPDVLFCDVMFSQELEAIDGFDVLDAIKKFDRDAKIILYSQFDEDENMRKAYKKGALSYLTKNYDSEDLIKAITTVSRGEVYFSSHVARMMAALNLDLNKKGNNSSNDIIDPREALNGRQLQVFVLLAIGKTQPEIARELNVHHRTITSDVKHIKDKLRTTSEVMLTMIALENGLIQRSGTQVVPKIEIKI